MRRPRPDAGPRLLRLRHTDEWVGLLVVLAGLVFVAAILEAGVLRRWLRPDAELRIVLPQTGFGGLAVGADIDVLGTHAGSVREIVLNPDGVMYALATIERQTEAFIAHDSVATIRLRYGVAGAAYVDLTRGTGAPMDWHYAVLTATAEPNPADTITATINQVRADLLPALDHASHAMATLDDLVGAIRAGQGSAGRLLVDDTLVRHAEELVVSLNTEIARLGPILAPVPGLLDQSRAVLANVRSMSADAARATPQLPALARNASDSSRDLPALLTQAQATTAEMEKLLTQLRGSWLLGGSGAPGPDPLRLPSREVRP